jgi:transposase
LWYGTALGTKSGLKTFSEIFKFSENKEGKFRLKVIEHFARYGLASTRSAFDVSKATIYRWRKAYLDARRNQLALIPRSRKPKKARVMRTDRRIMDFIRQIRQEHYRLSKWKIKPLLDEFCKQNNINSVSITSIGKIIKRHNLFFQPAGRIYHDPGSNRLRKINYRSRVRYSPKEKAPG